jgi:Outer membrane protein beta-barrel domain
MEANAVPAFILVALLLLLLGTPAVAAAQTAAPRWDVGVVTAGFYGHADEPADDAGFYSDDWYGGGQFGVSAGRYWTTHFKTEIEWNMTSEGRRYQTRLMSIPGVAAPVPISSEAFTQLRELSLGMTWQFFENEWVHPYLVGGVALDSERVRTRTLTRVYYPQPASQGGTAIVIPGSDEGPSTTTRARGLLAAGAKVYMSPIVFFRAEARGGLTPRVEHLSFRVGLGVDF